MAGEVIDPAQLADEYRAGASLRQLAERYPYSHATIRSILKAAGIPRRKTWGRYRDCPVCGRSFRARTKQICCSNDCRWQKGKPQ